MNFEGAGQHRHTTRAIDFALWVPRRLDNEMLISYWDLVRLRVIGRSFLLTECQRDM